MVMGLMLSSKNLLIPSMCGDAFCSIRIFYDDRLDGHHNYVLNFLS